MNKDIKPSPIINNIDFVLCLDSTESMEPFYTKFTNKLKTFYLDINQKLKEVVSNKYQIRIKIIAFSDYSSSNVPMMESCFYLIPDNLEDYEEFIDSMEPELGGDEDENGLEALYYAMNSDFKHSEGDQQIIILISDADALPLKERKAFTNYPNYMVTMDELINIWQGYDSDNQTFLRNDLKHLFIIAPTNTIYEKCCNEYFPHEDDLIKRETFIPIKPLKEITDNDYNDFINILLLTITNS